MKTVAIIHGAAEGAWHSYPLAKELRLAGFEVITKPKNADIIIAHSGGCYLIPHVKSYEKVLLINPTYWPERSYTERFFLKIYRDARYIGRELTMGAWLRKLAYNGVYTLKQPLHITRMFIATRRKRLPVTSSENCVVVRNRHDPWCAPDISERYKQHASFISLPGEHDDCWIHPKMYVALLQTK